MNFSSDIPASFINDRYSTAGGLQSSLRRFDTSLTRADFAQRLFMPFVEVWLSVTHAGLPRDRAIDLSHFKMRRHISVELEKVALRLCSG